MTQSKIAIKGLEEQQRAQETKQAKTTTGPGETSIPSAGAKSDQKEPSRSSEKPQQKEPGDLNEV